jgi:type IV secretory pathway VirJ component
MTRRNAAAALLLAVLAGCHTVDIPAAPSMGVTEPATLPLREMPARGPGTVFAVLMTGDGLFPGLTDELGKTLAHAGFPSVVWSSMRYYVHPHSPEESAADLDRVIRWYRARWHRPDVVLVGYSMGADVLPFLVNRLPPDTRGAVKGLALLGVSDDAVFQFRVEEWWGPTSAPTLPTLPEIQRLSVPLRFCAYGDGDDETACPDFGEWMKVYRLAGGHHFKGQADRVKQLILALAQGAENTPAVARSGSTQ